MFERCSGGAVELHSLVKKKGKKMIHAGIKLLPAPICHTFLMTLKATAMCVTSTRETNKSRVNGDQEGEEQRPTPDISDERCQIASLQSVLLIGKFIRVLDRTSKKPQSKLSCASSILASIDRLAKNDGCANILSLKA